MTSPHVLTNFKMTKIPVPANLNLSNNKSNDQVPTPYPIGKIGSLDYYVFRNDDFIKRNPSGPKSPDYYLSYGDKYAKRFTLETKPALSPEGGVWLEKAKRNLQIAIENRLNAIHPDAATFEKRNNGNNFKDFAFDSHVPAYWDAGLYKLSTLDLVKIGLTPDFKDLETDEGMRQVERIGLKFKDYWLEHPIDFARRSGEAILNKDQIELLIAEKVAREAISSAAFHRFFHSITRITL